MWNQAEFKKATGADLTANAEQLEAAFIKLTKRSAHTETGRALLARRLMEHNWTGSDAAQAMGISKSTVSRLAARGRILWLCGPGETELVWMAIEAIGYGDPLVALADVLEAMSPSDLAARRAVVLRTSHYNVVAKRLGNKTTPEKVNAIVDRIQANGHQSPLAVAAAIPATATALEIELPKAKRQTKAADKSAEKVPTTADALATLEAVQADRLASGEAEAYRDDEVAELKAIIARAARMLVAGKHMTAYKVADFVAAHLDEVQLIKAPLPAMQTGTVA